MLFIFGNFHFILPLLSWFTPLWFQSSSKGVQEPDSDPSCCQPRFLFPRPNGKSRPFWNHWEGNPKNSFQVWDYFTKPMAKHIQELAISPNYRMAQLVQENVGEKQQPLGKSGHQPLSGVIFSWDTQEWFPSDSSFSFLVWRYQCLYLRPWYYDHHSSRRIHDDWFECVIASISS